MKIPRRLPPLVGMEALGEHINDIRDLVVSLLPRLSKGTRTSHTTAGVSRHGLGKVEEAEGGTSEPVWL
jgi:hypothetical protein